jgi:hypothetical protein
MGSEDLKVIEAYQFLKSVSEKKPVEPNFRSSLAVGEVLAAIERSWSSERWEEVVPLVVSQTEYRAVKA